MPAENYTSLARANAALKGRETLSRASRDSSSPNSSGISPLPTYLRESPSSTNTSTCVEPDHRELIHSVATVLHRRIRDNETAESKVVLPLFCEDTHTDPEPEDRFALSMPLLHLQLFGTPTLYALTKLPPPPAKPRSYPVPDASVVATFIENIWHKARLTPQALVITLVYVDRLEAQSEGVLIHARSWRPVVFSSLLLASKVWHDISYWNSDFSSICPMFHIRNINRMERTYLQLLQYDTIISSSTYAQYYFSLRHAVRSTTPVPAVTRSRVNSFGNEPGDWSAAVADRHASETEQQQQQNFRTKYLMALNLPSASKPQRAQPAADEARVPPEYALSGTNSDGQERPTYRPPAAASGASSGRQTPERQTERQPLFSTSL